MKKDATAVGFIGVPDDNDIENLSKQLGKPITKIEKDNKTMLLIGKGLFKKRLLFPIPTNATSGQLRGVDKVL